MALGEEIRRQKPLWETVPQPGHLSADLEVFHFATKTCLHLSWGGVSAKCHSRVKFFWPNSHLLGKGSVSGLLNFSHGSQYRPHCCAEKGQFVLNLVRSRQCRCYSDVVFGLHFATGRFPGTGTWQPSLQNYWGGFCLLLHVLGHCWKMRGISTVAAGPFFSVSSGVSTVL